jgi:A/G-specific adenine glycosylase
MADRPASGQTPAALLLGWYDRHRRVLPWRALPGETPDPYRVWLSEIMLQQTTVQAVGGYFRDFVSRWPTVGELAAAPIEEVMRAWAGLGYYSRARNLHRCAGIVAGDHAGRFPAEEAALRALPGIGAYTAAAIAAIAFDRRAVVVDGNVERVVSRLFRVEQALPAAKPAIRALADGLTPDGRPGDFAQAMMDLGATVCTPRRPACGSCPLAAPCQARAAGDAEGFPRKTPRAGRPVRTGVTFVAIRADGAVLVRTRPPKGLLGGLVETPGTAWHAGPPPAEPLAEVPLPAAWEVLDPPVRHVFTHFPLDLAVWRAHVPKGTPAPPGHRWLPAAEIGAEAFSTLHRKVLRLALG